MAKFLALMCVKDSKVKERVDELGDTITTDELDELFQISCSDELSPWYCPVTCMDEGSPMYNKLKKNNWVAECGHKYDVIKEIKRK